MRVFTFHVPRITHHMRIALTQIDPPKAMLDLALTCRHHWRHVAMASVLSISLGSLAQQRYIPPPEQVVLPTSIHSLSARSGALREAERDWRQKPDDMAAALRYARLVFLLGLTEGDLRWFGSAKAALLPWWGAASLPAEGHFMRGLVRQGYHDFEGGLRDFDAAIALEPERPEFWSWRFAIHLLVSDIRAARADCDAMQQRFGDEEAQACRAILLYRTGHALQAAMALDKLVRQPGFQDGLSQDWLRFHLGEAWRVAGRNEQAMAVWEAHLRARPRTHAIRLALAELLNAQGLHARARQVTETPSPTDALLVQALLASQGLQDPDTARLAEMVESRLNSQALRKEDLIERPTMIYLIRYGRDVGRGLALAVQNWKTQNEPPDAVLLVQAALQQNQPLLAEPVLAWMAQTGYTDPVLQPLAEQLKARLGRR